MIHEYTSSNLPVLPKAYTVYILIILYVLCPCTVYFLYSEGGNLNYKENDFAFCFKGCFICEKEAENKKQDKF